MKRLYRILNSIRDLQVMDYHQGEIEIFGSAIEVMKQRTDHFFLKNVLEVQIIPAPLLYWNKNTFDWKIVMAPGKKDDGSTTGEKMLDIEKDCLILAQGSKQTSMAATNALTCIGDVEYIQLT